MHPTTQQLSKRNKVPAIIIVLAVVGDMVMDSLGIVHLHLAQIGGTQTLLYAIAAIGATILMLIAEPLMQKLTGRPTTAATKGAQPKRIDSSIIRRWELVWDEFEIDPDEPRAEITEFPSVLAQIEQIEIARLGSSDRTIRVILGERVMTLMREALGPLAAELSYLQQVSAIPVTGVEREPSLDQHVRDAAAELLAQTPI